MQYRNLGKSGLKVSEIGLGGSSFGREIGEEQSISLIHYALHLGINFIDTANFYNGGRSEEFIGRAIKGRRSEVIISTKFGAPMSESPNDGGASRYNILKALEGSLKRLDTDYIDLYYIHWPDATTPIEETLRTLDNLVRAGKVRYIGCSNFPAWQLCEALWISRVNNLESFVVVESRYNLLDDRRIESELVPCCQAHGIGVVPYEPLAGGFLTGKYQRGRQPPIGSHLAPISHIPQRPPVRWPSTAPHPVPILTDANFDKLENLQKYSVEHGHTIGELAIAWLLSHSWLSSVIAGATKAEQIEANIAAANWRLTPEEMAQLD